MPRIVIAGAGMVGASIAYHLALRGTRHAVLADLGGIAGRATGKAMGGVRQQFSTAPEVRLAQASVRLFQKLGPPLFEQVGYLFLATTESGLVELEERRILQQGLGVPVERVDPSLVAGLETSDVLGAVFCAEDGVADPSAVTHELVARAAARGVEVREWTDATALDADLLVLACGADSARVAAAYGVELPIRPLCRQLVETTPVQGLPAALPMTVEGDTGFHFRRRGDRLILAMSEPTARWGEREEVDEALVEDWLRRLHRRYPPAEGARVARTWAGLYDMTPDAHPIIGWVADGTYVACGFSGHGFMQAPAVGAAVAEELLDGESSFDLSAYRLERFGGESLFPETVVL